jgi:hypothetical protein
LEAIGLVSYNNLSTLLTDGFSIGFHSRHATGTLRRRRWAGVLKVEVYYFDMRSIFISMVPKSPLRTFSYSSPEYGGYN